MNAHGDDPNKPSDGAGSERQQLANQETQVILPSGRPGGGAGGGDVAQIRPAAGAGDPARPRGPASAETVFVPVNPSSTVFIGAASRPRPASPAPVVAAPVAEASPMQETEPVVAWLVIIAGPGRGQFRPLFAGNNTIGRGPDQRVPINFGDDAISTKEQAYVRYDAEDRKYLLIPNLAASNLISINGDKPTSAVPLKGGDRIKMGRTILLFAPLCGPEFDWTEPDAMAPKM